MNETVIKLEGNIIVKESRKLREKILELAEQGTVHITLDIDDVELVDSTGIGVLVGMQNVLRKKDGMLKVINVSSDIMKMFKIMRLDKHIEFESKND